MPGKKQPASPNSGFIRVKGAREHNLKNVDLEVPRDALVVFTGVSGSGKSSLAFGTLYAEAQRRYLESVSPYARRLFHQMSVPQVDSIDGLPPAVALQQQRGTPTTRSSVGSVTTLSNLVRMLYSRAGHYPAGQGIIYAEAFSSNTPEGACPACSGQGYTYDVSEGSMVPDDSLTIRERAIAAWPMAWGGQNQRDILVSMGYDVDTPWRDLPQADRDWILFTEEQPVMPVYPGYTPEETRKAVRRKEPPNYMGTFTSARRHVLHAIGTTQSAKMRQRALQYAIVTPCPACGGKKLRPESLTVTFAGLDITELSRLSLKALSAVLQPFISGESGDKKDDSSHPEKVIVRGRISADLHARLKVLLDLGLGYLSLDRNTPTLSPGELQRLRLATQLYSNLFGVVYVLDEPSAGLHPADTEALMRALAGLKAAGNSLFVVEHEPEVIRHADWIVDIGPGAGEKGGEVVYSGPPAGLRDVGNSLTAKAIFGAASPEKYARRTPQGWLKLNKVSRNNLRAVDAEFPLGVFTTVTGISGSGKSSLVSAALVELVAARLGQAVISEEGEIDDTTFAGATKTEGTLSGDLQLIRRLVQVDQKPIGRTPRSNMATYTGLFDGVRKLFAETKMAKARKYDAGRFSFNVAKGRCENCEGEGFVMVELLFLPSVYTPCPVCSGTRYNAKTLEVLYRDKNIADVLKMTVDEACAFFEEETTILKSLTVLREVGLGYLRLGQPATELSGGEAQRIKLATELQRSGRGATLYVLDEPTTGLHPSDVERLLTQLNSLVDAGNTVIVIEHDMHIAAASDWIIDIGPGAGEDGGRLVVCGVPEKVAGVKGSRTAGYLGRYLDQQ